MPSDPHIPLEILRAARYKVPRSEGMPRKCLKDFEVFGVYIRKASRMNVGTNQGANDPLLPTRSTLLSRLRNFEDDQSWRRFFDTYWKLIYGVALKSGLSDVEAQEVVQETVIAVCRNIGTFQYDRAKCSFKTWLMTVTRSRISNQFRRRRRHAVLAEAPGDETGTAWLEQLPDERTDGLSRLWDAEWEENLIDAAIERVKRRVPAEQFQMFDFYVLREWPADKVAQTLGVSTARVYLNKHRVGKLVKMELKQIEQEQACG